MDGFVDSSFDIALILLQLLLHEGIIIVNILISYRGLIVDLRFFVSFGGGHGGPSRVLQRHSDLLRCHHENILRQGSVGGSHLRRWVEHLLDQHLQALLVFEARETLIQSLQHHLKIELLIHVLDGLHGDQLDTHQPHDEGVDLLLIQGL